MRISLCKMEDTPYDDLVTPLYIINTVATNRKFRDKISPEQLELLQPYKATFEKLVDKRRSWKEKIKILKKTGSKYIPIFLEIFERVEGQLPGRKRRDCPICGAKALYRLSRHLDVKHGITVHDRITLLENLKKEEQAKVRQCTCGNVLV